MTDGLNEAMRISRENMPVLPCETCLPEKLCKTCEWWKSLFSKETEQ